MTYVKVLTEIQFLFYFIVAGKSEENGGTQHKQNGDTKAEVNGDIMTQNGDITDLKKAEVENELNGDTQGNVDGPTDNIDLTQNPKKHDPKSQNIEKILTNGIINEEPLESDGLLKNGHHSENRDGKATSDIEMPEKSDEPIPIEPNTNKISSTLSNEFETSGKHVRGNKLIKDLTSRSNMSSKPTTDSRENSNTNSSELKLDHTEKPSLDKSNTIIQEAIDIGKNQKNSSDAHPSKKIDIEDSIKPNLIPEVASEPNKINELDNIKHNTKDFQGNTKVSLSSEIALKTNNSTANNTGKTEIVNTIEANELQKSDSKDVKISPNELQTTQIPTFNDTAPHIVYSDLKSNVDANSLNENNLNISEPPLVDFKKDFVSNQNYSLPKVEVSDRKTIYDLAEPELSRVNGESVDQVATGDEVKGIELTDSLPVISGSEVLSSTEEPSASSEFGATDANESTIINTSKISDDVFNTSGNENNEQPENNEQIVSENDVDIACNITLDKTISDGERTPLKRIHSIDIPSYERGSTSGDTNVVIASRENSTTNLAETDGGLFNSAELVDDVHKDVKGLEVTFEEAEETEEGEEEEEGENTTNKEGKRKKRSFRKSFRKSVGKSIRKRSQENKCTLS